MTHVNLEKKITMDVPHLGGRVNAYNNKWSQLVRMITREIKNFRSGKFFKNNPDPTPQRIEVESTKAENISPHKGSFNVWCAHHKTPILLSEIYVAAAKYFIQKKYYKERHGKQGFPWNIQTHTPLLTRNTEVFLIFYS